MTLYFVQLPTYLPLFSYHFVINSAWPTYHMGVTQFVNDSCDNRKGWSDLTIFIKTKTLGHFPTKYHGCCAFYLNFRIGNVIFGADRAWYSSKMTAVTTRAKIRLFLACLYCQKQLKTKILIKNGIILILKSVLLKERCTLQQSLSFTTKRICLNINRTQKTYLSAIFSDMCDTPTTWYIHIAAQTQVLY